MVLHTRGRVGSRRFFQEEETLPARCWQGLFVFKGDGKGNCVRLVIGAYSLMTDSARNVPSEFSKSNNSQLL